MDINLSIQYSDDRLCEVVVCRPSDVPLYRIVSRRAWPGESATAAMLEVRRLYEITPWSDRQRRSDA